MGRITTELWETVGRIDERGFLYDSSNHCFARINDSGYINSLSRFETFGKIDEDGSVRDASGSVVGRIQADGYVYLHGRRVGRIDSSFVERITPKAWNAGQASSYGGRAAASSGSSSAGSATPFTTKLIIILVLGIVLGIVCMVSGAGGLGMLLAGPVVVALLYGIYKIFNH